MNKKLILITIILAMFSSFACKKKISEIDLKSITEDNAIEEAKKIIKELDSI